MTKEEPKQISFPVPHFNLELLAIWDLCAHKYWGLTTSEEIAVHLRGKHTSFTKFLHGFHKFGMKIHRPFCACPSPNGLINNIVLPFSLVNLMCAFSTSLQTYKSNKIHLNSILIHNTYPNKQLESQIQATSSN
ncbi:hypothetical protein RDI58_012862 [Solanum bulbocastanum]|uniref:Uncharacterized protein n=1 Tax=Solanum bulbocastanum TaxID=147425 RepID=A0AAN8TIF8_SOLBU